MKTLEQTRDELAKKWSEGWNPAVPWEETTITKNFRAGFDACVKFLSEQAGEFDRKAFDEWWEAQSAIPNAEEGARWQFEQDRARIGHAEAALKHDVDKIEAQYAERVRELEHYKDEAVKHSLRVQELEGENDKLRVQMLEWFSKVPDSPPDTGGTLGAKERNQLQEKLAAAQEARNRDLGDAHAREDKLKQERDELRTQILGSWHKRDQALLRVQELEAELHKYRAVRTRTHGQGAQMTLIRWLYAKFKRKCWYDGTPLVSLDSPDVIECPKCGRIWRMK